MNITKKYLNILLIIYKNKMNISVVIPCYNEKTIETVVDKILKIQNLERKL